VTDLSWTERLAEHLGVLPSYIGQDGQARVTSSETREAILAAMGLPVSSEHVAEERLNELFDEGRKRLLEPVVVHERGAAHPRLRTHAPRRGGALRWKIEIRSQRGRVALREGLYDSAGPLEIETPNLGIGYYDVRLTLTGSQGELKANQTLIVVPPRCIAPSEILGDRDVFGVAANLYTLRGDVNWGIGDTGDLSALVNWVGGIGGWFSGLDAETVVRYAPAVLTPIEGRSGKLRMSAYCAASVSIRRPAAPSTIGGRGCWTVFGAASRSWIW